MGQERLGPSYFFIPLVLVPLNSLVWYVPSLRYTRGLRWRMHCGVEVTESSTNKQHHLSGDTSVDVFFFFERECMSEACKCVGNERPGVRARPTIFHIRHMRHVRHIQQVRAWETRGLGFVRAQTSQEIAKKRACCSYLRCSVLWSFGLVFLVTGAYDVYDVCN